MERSVIYTTPLPPNPKPKPHPPPHPPLPTRLSPEIHFPLQTVFAPDRPAYPRFVNRFNPREILLAVDGSCLNNGRHASKSTPPLAACAFLFKAVPSHHLERRGPAGDAVEHMSNRAKLRAVVAALQFRPWDAEGWRRVVVLTDLEYLVLGATRWVGRWVKPGAGRGGYYANRDLWEVSVERMEELRDRGCEVSFWLVKRGERRVGLLGEAKEAAREAVGRGDGGGGWVEGLTRVCAFML